MSTYTCPHCRGPLQLTLSGGYGYCHACALELNDLAFAPIGHSRPHPTGRTLGQVARDEGMARVLENAGQEWRDQVARVIDDLARSIPEFTADQIRFEAKRVGLPPPHHHNAWGAAVLAAAKRGTIERTEREESSARPKAHGHINPVWRSLIYRPAETPATMPLYTPEEVW